MKEGREHPGTVNLGLIARYSLTGTIMHLGLTYQTQIVNDDASNHANT